ncbi:MAG: hypothetical protein ACO4CZ_03225, partial [Planctomycetota bacterium]
MRGREEGRSVDGGEEHAGPFGRRNRADPEQIGKALFGHAPQERPFLEHDHRDRLGPRRLRRGGIGLFGGRFVGLRDGGFG